MERFAFRAFRSHDLDPNLFERARFFSLQKGDTFYSDWPEFVDIEDLESKYDAAQFIGDKLPRLYKVWEQVAERFPGAHIVFIVRNIFDVAASYNARAQNENDKYWSGDQDFRKAVEDWNEANESLLEAPASLSIHCVTYEDMFSDRKHASTLFQRLGLSIDPSLIRGNHLWQLYSRASELRDHFDKTNLTEFEKRYICRNANMAAYQQIESQFNILEA